MDVLRKAEDRTKLIDIFCRKANRNDLSESLKALIVRATEEWAPANILSVADTSTSVAMFYVHLQSLLCYSEEAPHSGIAPCIRPRFGFREQSPGNRKRLINTLLPSGLIPY